MSWFGGGSKKEEPAEKSFLGDLDATHDSHVPISGGGGGGAGSAMAEIQQFGAALQQQILVQQAITDMSDRAFVKCITSSMKDPQLSGREVACIQASTNKWLDTNELLMGRLARKQQQQQQAGGFH